MSTKYLVEEKDYDFLKKLGLEKTNIGVFSNRWDANGQVRIYQLYIFKTLSLSFIDHQIRESSRWENNSRDSDWNSE